ncbi:hypothetical protein C6P45_003275 [Maudiozyma exigua]|uniref:Non-structural maintenance of chromosomes element 1 homolog n=1 Tax=Maudiozyma exigua TaxID=34358 RepID=A0A9P7B2E7_MAUEX|nr:hypothetical protein C6P45_003275 [Kazachstania exigua]
MTETYVNPEVPGNNGYVQGVNHPRIDISKQFILQYIIECNGVCHENVLLIALMNLKLDQKDFDKTLNIKQWLEILHYYIDEINVKLNPMMFKIVTVNHDLGQRQINSRIQSKFENFMTQINRNHIMNNNNLSLSGERIEQVISNNMNPLTLPQSNKFYVYINAQSTNETKLATNFTPREIEFIKWAIQQFIDESNIIQYRSGNFNSQNGIVTSINKILSEKTRNPQMSWNQYITYTVGSTQLSSYKDLSPLETEEILKQLTDLKWFYRTNNGKFGMDIRCIAELHDLLINNYDLPICQICNRIVQMGVTCGNISHFSNEEEEDDEEEDNENKPTKVMWHVDCFQYYMSHVSENCNGCNSPLIIGGLYVV